MELRPRGPVPCLSPVTCVRSGSHLRFIDFSQKAPWISQPAERPGASFLPDWLFHFLRRMKDSTDPGWFQGSFKYFKAIT